MPGFREAVEFVGLAVDGVGVLVMVLGILIASVRFVLPASRRAGGAYRTYRQEVGKAILLGLELLVASDIIRTVAIAPTLQSVLVLGLIVLIRTFLSFALEVELEGRLPWKQGEVGQEPRSASARTLPTSTPPFSVGLPKK